MITELNLQNFRCFNDHTITFKPISVVIGRNNAGKSTLVEALRLVSIVVSRYQSLAYCNVPDWAEIPRREIGVSPSLKGMEFNFSTVFHRYSDPPSIISARFNNDSAIRIYLGGEDRIHAVVFDQEGKIVKTRIEANKLRIPSVEIMPQVAPVSREERTLTSDYVKAAISSHLAPLHFRNQLRIIKEYYPVFKEMAETTWPGLQVRELTGGGLLSNDLLQLMIRDEDFVAEVASMGHGLQMWLQTMWFLARSSKASTVILDEPDVYMHPDIQRRLIRYIKNRIPQIIVTTHSVEIMSEVDVDEILIIDRKQPRSRFAGTLPAVQKLIEKIVGPYVFQKRDGTRYKSVKTTWNKCCAKAGVQDAHIHDIRHKAITDMGKKGYSLQEIAKAAGHSQISTTMRYTHLRAEDTREALESLGRKE